MPAAFGTPMARALLVAIVVALPKGLSTTPPLRGAGRRPAPKEGGERADFQRRLEEVVSRRLSVKPESPRWMQDRGLLPALEVAGLRLSEVALSHASDPFVLRHAKVPKDHGLRRTGPAERRLHALHRFADMPLVIMRPRDKVIVMAILNVVVQPNVTLDRQANLSDIFYNESLKTVFHEGNGPIDLDRLCGEEVIAVESRSEDPGRATPGPTLSPTAFPFVDPEAVKLCPEQACGIYEEETTCPTRGGWCRWDGEACLNTRPPLNSTARLNFEREWRFLNATQHFLRSRIAKKNRWTGDYFYGLRLMPCDDLEAAGKRCEDDIGVSLAVYEDEDNKVIVFHGNQAMDVEYVKWAMQTQIIERMEEQIFTQWTTNAKQPLTKDMSLRRGNRFWELATRCAFKDQQFKAFGVSEDEIKRLRLFDSLPEPMDEVAARASGLWPFVARLLRVIMPKDRSKVEEKKKTITLTGGGLGGSFAALASMFFKHIDFEAYPTIVIAPFGFQCMATTRMVAGEMDPGDDHSQIKVYQHVFDAYAGLGGVGGGQVCSYGRKAFTSDSQPFQYCERIVGHTGPQLMYDAFAEEEPRLPLEQAELAEPWEKYKTTVRAGWQAFHACHFFTHSVWYAATLFTDPLVLYPDGSTDAGCIRVKGVPAKDDLNTCPTDTPSTKLCGEEIPDRLVVPLSTLTAILVVITLCISIGGMGGFVLLGAIKNDDWIYGKQYRKYGEHLGIIDRRILCPCCKCLWRRSKKTKALDFNRAEFAMTRARERTQQSFELKILREMENKQKKKEQGSYEKVEELATEKIVKELHRRREENKIRTAKKKHDDHKVFFHIICAENIRSKEFQGKSDTTAVVEIPGKKGCRIVTQSVQDAMYPVWDFIAELPGYEEGDDVAIGVWDADRTSKDPEYGDYLGGVSLDGDGFYPHGLPPTTYDLQVEGTRYRFERRPLNPPCVTVAVHCLLANNLLCSKIDRSKKALEVIEKINAKKSRAKFEQLNAKKAGKKEKKQKSDKEAPPTKTNWSQRVLPRKAKGSRSQETNERTISLARAMKQAFTKAKPKRVVEGAALE